ncbi:MAG: hypothetical protein J2P25_06440 [Nocardiopsaceae bacterium]|nr:hypothetical protein [Nocardiopsaceae bacterium]
MPPADRLRPADDGIHLAGDGIRLTIDRRTGALAGLESAETGWRVTGRPELAAGFRLLIPLPGRRNNLAYGERQEPPEIQEVSADEVVLSWPQVRSAHGGTHPIGVTQRISVRDRHALFETTIDNRSDRVVENVWAPCLGDLRPPAPEEELRNFCYSYGTAAQLRMWPKFENTCGYWGVDYPTQMASRGSSAGVTPVSPFMLVLARDQGLYVGVAERRDDLVSWHSELVPGFDDAIAGRPAADATIRFATVHVPFIPPGAKTTLTPVAVELFRGDWHAGADIYRRWREGWMPAPTAPAWADEPHSWLQLHINSPEDELRIPFRELPAVGRECAEAGVRAIQLVGWNSGGQDHGNPSHRPDPRLGTAEELRDAIARIHALGVKVVLFSKFTWADRSTERYPSLAADTIKNSYGDTYNGASYRYQTPTQLLGINAPHLIPMCFGSDRYLDTCQEEFGRIVDLGAAGMLFDECQHHADALLCFDDAHGHPVPWPVYANDNELVRRFRERTSSDPEFLYSGEGLYDWEFEQYHLSYFRSAGTGHIPLNRYLHPHAALMTAATGFDDRNLINQCLLYRYLVSYEPFNFKGMPSDFPKTIAYGQRMDALRTELREWFWDGTFRDTIGARVRGPGGRPHHPYAVFLHRDTGEPALAIANYAEEPASVEIDGIGAPLTYRLVDDEEWRETDGRVDLPARSAAVVLPEESTR